ncbi:phage virion morphogenesis protein [uncultured Campylobacter sp.]|uniref:phage virion morphogenesis protein n=1 Tax=uncultured Campylobacter sp. TaxID=218934 RepID=UPI00262072A0|nr:phage virion morphogenesis protein [uncultured Campylobacter sp.]
MSIKITGMDEIEAKLTALQNSLSGAQMKSKLARIGEKVRTQIELSFERERSPFGQAWTPLSVNTAIAYMRKSGARGGARRRNRVFLAKFGAGGSKKILRVTGHLAELWSVDPSETSVTISNNSSNEGFPYGLTHQFGSHNGWGRGIYIPARPFLSIDKSGALLPSLQKDIENYLIREIEKAVK